MFAVQALRAAGAGLPLPTAPSPVPKADKPEAFVGQYHGSTRSFAIRCDGAGITLVQGDASGPLYSLGDDLFARRDPAFAEWPIEFERKNGKVVAAHWGSESFALAGSGWIAGPTDPALARMAGRYADDDPWNMPVRVVERGGKLFAITDDGGELIKVADDNYTIGKALNPDRIVFANPIDGRPQTLLMSGIPLSRRDL
jgi:hypothetical protein